MTDREVKSKEVQDTFAESKEHLQINEETAAKMKKLGLKAPGMIRGMMDELSDFSIIFLE